MREPYAFSQVDDRLDLPNGPRAREYTFSASKVLIDGNQRAPKPFGEWRPRWALLALAGVSLCGICATGRAFDAL